jgi:outer membrane murein-binding lipoprotein Lpp
MEAKESQIQTANASLQTKISESNQLEQQVRLLTTDNQSLKTQLDSIQKLVKNTGNPQTQNVVEQIQNQTNKTSTELQLLQKQLSKKDTEIEQLNQKINVLTNQLNDKTNYLQKIGTNLQDLNTEIGELTQKNNSLKSIIIQATQDINQTMENINNIINSQNISNNTDVASSLTEIMTNIDNILNQLKSVSESNLNSIPTVQQAERIPDSDDENDEEPNLTSSVTGALQGATGIMKKLIPSNLFSTKTEPVPGQPVNRQNISLNDFDSDSDSDSDSNDGNNSIQTNATNNPVNNPIQSNPIPSNPIPSNPIQSNPSQIANNDRRSFLGQISNIAGNNPEYNIPTDNPMMPLVKMGRNKVLAMLDKEFKDLSLDPTTRGNIAAMINLIKNSDIDNIGQIEARFKELNIVCQGCTGKQGIGKFIVKPSNSTGGKTRRVRKLNKRKNKKTKKQKGGFTYSKKNKRHKISSPVSSKMSSSRWSSSRRSSSRRSSSRPRRKRGTY